MSSGGGTTTTSSNTTSAPYAPTQPYINDLLTQAQGLYQNSSQNTGYAPFNTVVQPSATTQQGLDLTAQRATNGSPVVGAADNSLTNILQQQSGNAPGSSALTSLLNGYYNPGASYTQAGAAPNSAIPMLNGQLGQTNGATGLVSGMANNGVDMAGNPTLQNAANGGMNNAATGMAGSLASSGPSMGGNATLQAGANGQYTNAANPLAAYYATLNPNANPANQYLSGEAATTSINPYLKSMYDASSPLIANTVNAQFSQAGRTGSAANQSVLTQDLGNYASNLYGTNYNQAVQNQQAAANSVQNAYDNGANRNLSATNMLGQFSGQDIANKLASANNLNAGNTAAYNAQTNATNLYGNLSGQNISNQLSAANNLNAGNTSAYNAQGNLASLLSQISGQDLSRNDTIASQIGGLNDSQAQRSLSAGSQLSSDAASQASTIGSAANSLNSNANTMAGQQLQAVQQAPALANQDYTDLQNLLNVGGAQDAQKAAQIQDLLTRWQYGQQQPWNLLNNYSGLITGYAGLGGQATGTGTQTVPGQSLIPSLIGAGATAATMMSDRRAKTNIRRISTFPNGLPMYSFRYKGGSRTHIGLMAQDVQKVRPEAIIACPDGLMAVNYDIALAA